MFYRSSKQAAGIMLWPTDGHPASMAAILAHPGDIASVAVSCDGRRLITASRDGHVNQWTVNSLALQARTEAAGKGPKRWQSVLGSDISFEEVQRHVPHIHLSLRCFIVTIAVRILNEACDPKFFYAF